MIRRLKFDSYLDADGDFFVWLQDAEGYRWYGKEGWGYGEQAVETFIRHIALKEIRVQIDIVRLRKLAEISMLGRPVASTGLAIHEVYASLFELGHV